jgi:hypothetical protein
MPTATYTPLANVTLASTSTSITFGSIPATYRDLIVVFQGLSGGVGNFQTRLRLNGDTGNNYNWQRMSGTGTSSFASTAASQNNLNLTFAAEAQTTTQVQHRINIMDYSATDKHKTVISRADNAAQATEAVAGRWANTAAVTSVQLFPSSATFGIGTTVALYGVIS